MKKSFGGRHRLDEDDLAKGHLPPFIRAIEQWERLARRRLIRVASAKARLRRALAADRRRAQGNTDDGDNALFFVKWLQSPLRIGAVAPSSRYLARAMAKEARPIIRQSARAATRNDIGRNDIGRNDIGRNDLAKADMAGIVIELGGGTGSITRALLETGLAPEQLVVVERDRRLHAILQRRFPTVRVVQGDARELVGLMADLGIDEAAAVVSSLPLISMPKQLRRQIVEQSFKLLGNRGSLIQFTYSLAPPLSARDHGLLGRLATRVWLNLPPAAVWRFRRDPDALAA